MLINFSNHPVKDWSDNQLNLAKSLYEAVTDIPFPDVDPESDEAIITELAENYASLILNNLPESRDNNAVHIMGEHTLTYSVIRILQNRNVKCIASTAPRDSIVDYQYKISKFNFVRFREYPTNV